MKHSNSNYRHHAKESIRVQINEELFFDTDYEKGYNSYPEIESNPSDDFVAGWLAADEIDKRIK